MLTFIPDNMTVTYWNDGRRNARTVQASRTCSITARMKNEAHITSTIY